MNGLKQVLNRAVDNLSGDSTTLKYSARAPCSVCMGFVGSVAVHLYDLTMTTGVFLHILFVALHECDDCSSTSCRRKTEDADGV